jgi:hypothetical protein
MNFDLVLLVVDAAAIFVLGPVQAVLLALCQMTVVLGLINALALRDIGIVCFVTRCFLAVHRATSQALIDAGLLIVEPLIDLIYARMVRNGLRHA